MPARAYALRRRRTEACSPSETRLALGGSVETDSAPTRRSAHEQEGERSGGSGCTGAGGGRVEGAWGGEEGRREGAGGSEEGCGHGPRCGQKGGSSSSESGPEGCRDRGREGAVGGEEGCRQSSGHGDEGWSDRGCCGRTARCASERAAGIGRGDVEGGSEEEPCDLL